MNLHSRDVPCNRCRLAIVDHASRRGSDQHDVVGKERSIEIPRENVSRRDEAVGPWRRVIQPYPPGGIGWYHQRADADRGQPGLFAKVLLTVCPGGATNIAVRAKGEPEDLGGERRIRLVAELQNKRNPADHMIPVGILIEEAIAGGGGFQCRQVGNDRRKAVDPAERIVAGESKARLRGGRPGVAMVGQYKPSHGRHRAESLGEPLIGIW